jgi:ABC-type tungstate transport system substrate-binding protein
MSTAHSEALRRRWHDPAYRARQSAILRQNAAAKRQNAAAKRTKDIAQAAGDRAADIRLLLNRLDEATAAVTSAIAVYNRCVAEFQAAMAVALAAYDATQR